MSRETLTTQFWQAAKILRQDDNTNSLLDYVEQVSWLLFLKCLEELDQRRRAEAEYAGRRIVPPELDGAVVSGHYFAYEVDQSLLDRRFLGFWLKTEDPLSQVLPYVRGALNYAAVRSYDFAKIKIPLPPLPEQERIANALGRALSRISEARQLQKSFDEEQRDFLSARARELAEGAPRIPLKNVAPLIRRPVTVTKGGSYPELGIRSFGRGTFHKPTLRGRDLTWQKLYRIQSGDLLFSNIKAWEGAIAAVGMEDDGRVGSHRYLTCVPNDGTATAEFLAAWFLTSEGLAEVGKSSPGATDRNRTLGLKKLPEIPVPVPRFDLQLRFSRVARKLREATALQRDFPAELEALQSSLLDQAFSGNL